MEPYENIHAVIFDLGGVILNLDMKRTFEAFRESGVAIDPERYAAGGHDEILFRYEKGEVDSNHFLHLMCREFPDCSPDTFVRCWNSMLLDLPPERLDFLKALAKKMPVYLLSNTNEIHIEAFEKAMLDVYGRNVLEEHFDEVYYSCRMGMRKPDVEIYEFLVEKHGLNPSETLFVDDNPDNVEGAARAGLQTLHITPPMDITEKLSFLLPET